METVICNIITNFCIVFHMIYMNIKLDAICSNIEYVNAKTNNKTCAVVKANAYGSGIERITELLYKKVQMFAVANEFEYSQILCKFPQAKVLIFNSDTVGNLSNNAIFSVSNKDDVDRISSITNVVAVKVNCGMNRFGCAPHLVDDIVQYAKHKGLSVVQIYTHFPSAEIAKKNINIFTKCTNAYDGKVERHCCSSNFFHLGDDYKFDTVRTGLALYGYGYKNLTPACEIYTTVAHTFNLKSGNCVGYGQTKLKRNSKIAILSAGYADGLVINNNLHFAINGKLCKIIDRPCMDTVMVDVSETTCNIGDRAYLLGNGIDMDKCTKFSGTFAHHILTSIHTRVIRNYV